MAWAKVDDRLHGHIKAQRAGEAMALWVLALSWCCAYLTDGEVPADLPKRLYGRRGERWADRLVDVKLWEKTSSGFKFCSWREYQTERCAIEAKRAEARTRMQRVRGVSSDVRANEQRSSQRVRAKFADGSREVREPKSDTKSEAEEEKKTESAREALAFPSASAGPVSASPVQETFDYWRQVHKHPNARLDPKRKAAIERALKSHGADVVRRAIDGCARSDFHKARGKHAGGHVHDDLTLILRDATHVERFADLAGPVVKTPPQSSVKAPSAPELPKPKGPIVPAAGMAAHVRSLIAQAKREQFAEDVAKLPPLTAEEQAEMDALDAFAAAKRAGVQ